LVVLLVQRENIIRYLPAFLSRFLTDVSERYFCDGFGVGVAPQCFQPRC
jgi:hypothetical protein